MICYKDYLLFIAVGILLLNFSGCGDSGETSGRGDNGSPSEYYIIVDLLSGTVSETQTISDLESNDDYKTTKIVLKKMNAGSFLMGDEAGDGDPDELPVHTVNVSGFYIGVFEITQRQWNEVMGTWPSYHTTDPDKRPVEYITWTECQDFVTQLNAIISEGGFRLPTEAEWEYACKAGTSTNYSYGNTANGDYMWYDNNSDTGKGQETHEVGTKFPNPWGLYDMHGNILEWCEDDYHSDYNGAPADGSAWIDSPRDDYRINRGGPYSGWASSLRSSNRAYLHYNGHAIYVGFRIARTSP